MEFNKQDKQILISILNNEIKERKRLLKNLNNIIYNLEDKEYWERRKNGCKNRIKLLESILTKF